MSPPQSPILKEKIGGGVDWDPFMVARRHFAIAQRRFAVAQRRFAVTRRRFMVARRRFVVAQCHFAVALHRFAAAQCGEGLPGIVLSSLSVVLSLHDAVSGYALDRM